VVNFTYREEREWRILFWVFGHGEFKQERQRGGLCVKIEETKGWEEKNFEWKED